jgi:hypothetical protein
MFIIKALQACTIQGKDAEMLAKLINKVGKAFERQVEKENSK